MNGGGAYGAGRAGVPFDPVSFLQKPQVILRLLCWVRNVLHKLVYYYLHQYNLV